jgi:DhnA family fructose-bisphosphate aldolase class Ia
MLRHLHPLSTMSKASRLSCFLQSDGRTVIVPIDHGTAIPVPGLEDTGALIEALSPNADGFVVNLGVAQAFRDVLGDKGVCLRTDCYKPVFGENTDEGAYRLYGADEAEEVGAHAMMNMLYVHHRNEAEIFRECAELIAESLEAEIPVIVETLPFGIGRPRDYTVENISFAVRAAAELGADIVKTAYPTGATTDQFKAIVDACFVPLIILGGSAMGDDAALLTMVKNAVDAGSAGIAVGRNVWQHPAPAKITAALKAIVHDSASVEQALLLTK